MSEEQIVIDGIVLYIDGSFRWNQAGWGVHGYTYTAKPLTQGIGTKQLPTPLGYKTIELTESVTPINYLDGFGRVHKDPSNNTGELEACIKAFEHAFTYDTNHLVILTDSEYVLKGLSHYIKKWMTQGWVTTKNEPVANRSYWERLHALEQRWITERGKPTLLKVKAHSGEQGNDLADMNARNGSGGNESDVWAASPPHKYHKPDVSASPLYLKTRMIFNIGEDAVETPGFYYMYQLGRMQNYGHKKEDTLKERHDKTDLLFGRRISDATFCVVHRNEPDPFLENLKRMHSQIHQQDTVDLVVARLDNAYKAKVYQRIQQLDVKALINVNNNGSLITPMDELVTKTLSPPRLARDGVGILSQMHRQLVEFEEGTLGSFVNQVDITDVLFAEKTKAKKTVAVLKPEITNQTRTVDVTLDLDGSPYKLGLVLGVDIPMRNPLAKIADLEPQVVLLVFRDGPEVFSYATVFKTSEGNVMYRSPYTQFIVPKK